MIKQGDASLFQRERGVLAICLTPWRLSFGHSADCPDVALATIGGSSLRRLPIFLARRTGFHLLNPRILPVGAEPAECDCSGQHTLRRRLARAGASHAGGRGGIHGHGHASV
jgi:hypothetical protein